MTMTDRALDAMDDADLDAWVARKRDVLARATSLLDVAEAEVEKIAGLMAEAELHERPDLDALREAFRNAGAARNGRHGAHVSATKALDDALAEQRRRAESNARSAADAARRAFDEHVVRIGTEATAAAAAMAMMMAEFHARAVV
jgi:hypothetical protein